MTSPLQPPRRTALRTGLTLGASMVWPHWLAAQPARTAERPDPALFQTGDLVWPKPPGAFVPYAGSPTRQLLVTEPEVREEEWNTQRVQFIRDARQQAQGLSGEERDYLLRLANTAETLSYSRFFHQYAGDVSPDDFQTYGVGELAYVGHVGLIEVDPTDQQPYVVEAVYGRNLACTSCVQRVPYADWLQARGNVLVWLGRLRQLDAAQRTAVVNVAKQQLNKPYNFFNFDLSDDRGFYCSKLVWYAVKQATGIALDGNPQARRLVWFSPLQAMKASSQVMLISSPGNYRNL